MKKIKLLLSLVLLTVFVNVQSQDKVTIEASADVVNQFIYRGANAGGNSAQIQPLVYADYKQFEVGAWGSYGITNNYNEIDLYVKYTLKCFSIQYMNYNIANMNNTLIPVGLFNPNNSGNMGEINISYKGSTKFPIKLTLATIVYSDAQTENMFGAVNKSTYFEVDYPIYIGEQSIDLFVGGTPSSGLYGTKLGVITTGATIHNNVKITDSFSLPTYISISGNPQTKNLFFVFGLTI